MQEWPLNEQLIISMNKKGFCLKLMQINNYNSDTIYVFILYALSTQIYCCELKIALLK